MPRKVRRATGRGMAPSHELSALPVDESSMFAIEIHDFVVWHERAGSRGDRGAKDFDFGPVIADLRPHLGRAL